MPWNAIGAGKALGPAGGPRSQAPTATPETGETNQVGAGGGCHYEMCGCSETLIESGGLGYCSDLCADAAQADIQPRDAPCPCLHPECSPTGKGG